MPAKKRQKVEAAARDFAKGKKWIPNPGPQTEAYFSKADVLLYGGAPGGGKQLDIMTPIITPFGWVTMGELQIGDQVFDEKGAVCNVVGKSELDDTEDAYKLIFSDGSEIIAGERHQWVTSDRKERLRKLKCSEEYKSRRRASRPSRAKTEHIKPWVVDGLVARNKESTHSKNLPTSSIRTTKEIAGSLYRKDGGVNHSVEVCEPVQLPDANLLIDPYVLGVWLGDGSNRAGAITGVDKEIFGQIAVNYIVTDYSSGKTKGVIGLVTQLKAIGVYGNKHIPITYKRSSIGQRLALLQGLMDTDGHANDRGQCEICMVRRELIYDIQELICSLGIKANIVESVASLNGKAVGPKYTIKFMTELPAFRLPRKLLKQKRAGFRGTHKQRYIISCVKVPNCKMQCIQVDSPSHMYLAGRSMIPTHNSQLCLGLAFNEHRRSLLMRRQYTDIGGLVEQALKIHGSRAGFNGSPPPRLKISDDQSIQFAAAARLGDEKSQMGTGRDLMCFDEATHFSESQIRFVMGWNRTDVPGQRCRVVLATNPPLTAEGLWIIEMFAPWLDKKYPNKAMPGELRWVISDEDGKDLWVDGPDDCREIGGKMRRPMSRTYIPSNVADNPYYVGTDYERTLDSMPEPYRSLLMGGFQVDFKDQPFQCIPTAWVLSAQARWNPNQPQCPQCAIGADCTGGGDDPLVIASRYDGWYAPLVKIPGKDIPIEKIGSVTAGAIIAHRRDGSKVVVDLGGGYGSSAYEKLIENGIDTVPYKGAAGTLRKSESGLYSFTNTRSAAYWLFREALDPEQPGGSCIQLPDDPRILSTLTAPIFEIVKSEKGLAVKLETKVDVCERLGYSTDEADAIVMAWWDGLKSKTNALDLIDWRKSKSGKVGVIPSGRQPLTARRSRR